MEPGSVYLFGQDTGGPQSWGEEDKATANSTPDGLGYSVSISDGRVLAGAPYDHNSGQYMAGAAYLFDIYTLQ